MIFNKHLDLEGKHAFLSASKYHWLNYDENKVAEVYRNSVIVPRKGTELHEFAEFCIKIGQPLPRNQKTLNTYVNDAIGYKMLTEQKLYYSENCFGTADAISFRNKKLRIHDLKTGIIPAHMEQLMIYAALFCLEYNVKPKDIEIELRIYQNNEIVVCNPTDEEISQIMDKIVSLDEIVDKVREQEG